MPGFSVAMRTPARVVAVWLAGFVLAGAARAADDLTCLKPETGAPAPSTLFYDSLRAEAYQSLDRRRDAYEKLKTVEEIQAYQKRLREFFVEQLGGFPEHGPLNAQTTGRVVGDGYTIEKVIFDSQPGHRITANLYLPAGTEVGAKATGGTGATPIPAVLVSSGHSRTAKTAGYNQRFAIIMAKNGIAALAYDPIGQGERSQFLTADGKPQFSGTTTEHFLVGVGAIPTGTGTARYRAWDGIRAIDYLASRPEIDMKRIGFTGCSGGGTLTSYIMALDDRIACAAPACYLTTFRRLLETIGPQDAEQNIFGQVGYGLDQPDYVILRAPRPTIISATTGDFFDIQGTWDNYRQAKRIYARFGYPERVDLVEAEGGHGVQPGNLVGIVRWMRRWLLGRDEAVPEPDIKTHPEADLLCTPQGQVLRLPGEKSVIDLNADRAAALEANRKKFWESTPRAETLAKVRAVAGIRPLADIPPAKWEKAGKVQRDGYHIDKVVLRTDTGVPLPALTFHPPEPRDEAYLYVHDGGKAADDGPDGPIVKLVKEGYVVVAVDLRGWGETAAGKPDPLLGDWKTFYLSYLLGKSLVGMRTEDILTAGRWVANYQSKQPREVRLVGVGKGAVPALHAAALEPSLFRSVTLRDGLDSWSSLARQRVPAGQLENTVHGALRFYDLPDLRRAVDSPAAF
ncbi:MAG: Acetyl esterase Axe7A precursor [Planctomycetota bacterium]